MLENEVELASLISSMETPFSEINALGITQLPTNPEWIKERRNRGQTFSYVSGDVVIRILNKAFRNRWSFEIKETRIVNSSPQKQKDSNILIEQNPVVQVLGRMTIPGWGVREQWGAQPIVGGQDVQEHAFKSASTDAMKKCASLFGVTLDLYGQQGMSELMISVEDYLRDDEKTFDKVKEQILAKSREKELKAELEKEDTMEEEVAGPAVVPYEEEKAVAEKPTKPVEEKVEEKVVEEPIKPVENTTFDKADIVDMKKIKTILNIQSNDEFDKYVKEFMNLDTATMKGNINPNNIRDFITYLEINYIK